MANHRTSCFALALSALLIGGTACLELEVDEPVGSHGLGVEAGNGFAANGLPHNGLPHNGLPHNGLPHNGLPHNGLPHNGLPSSTIDTTWNGWLNDDTDVAGTPRKTLNRTLMKYIAKCALSGGTDSTFTDDNLAVHAWSGEIGIAPAWETGGITAADGRWITSCVASLVNADAVSVVVSQRGQAGSVMDTMAAGEETVFTTLEGAYFGDMFADPPTLYTCRGTGYTSEVNTGRACSITSGTCSPVMHVGDCDAVCSSETRSVNGTDFPVYYNCDPDGVATGVDPFAEVTTIYLDPTR